MKRREFLGLVAGVAGLPLTVRAQQTGAAVVGFLHKSLVDWSRGRGLRL